MGTIFTLTADIKAIARTAIDDLIQELGKDCRLLFPPLMKPCVNCLPDVIGKKSSNFWVNGGPIPFPGGTLCPMCDGKGLRAEQATAPIRMLIAWKPEKWVLDRLPNIEAPGGLIQTKGYLADVPKILQARQMVIETQIEGVMRYAFELASEPIDASNIIQGRYFVALWRRRNG